MAVHLKRSPPDHRPLYQKIRDAIETKIMSGALRPGDRIPIEHELMAEYGCSRMTVNKALSSLAAAGLISRQRRRGSFVNRAGILIPDQPGIAVFVPRPSQPVSAMSKWSVGRSTAR